MRPTNLSSDHHPSESTDRIDHALRCARSGSRADSVPYVVTVDGSAFAACLQTEPETTLFVVHTNGSAIPVR